MFYYLGDFDMQNITQARNSFLVSLRWRAIRAELSLGKTMAIEEL